jgi:argininosuccinate synthase
MSITYTEPYKRGDIRKVVLAYSGGLDTSRVISMSSRDGLGSPLG